MIDFAALYPNVPIVTREPGIKKTPLKKFTQNGVVHFDHVFLNYSDAQTIDYNAPLIFLDTREIPITFHRHDYLEIVYVLSGTLLSKSRQDVILLKEGDIWLSHLHAEHALACYDGPATIVNICIPVALLTTGAYQHFCQEYNQVADFLRQKIPEVDYLYFPSYHSNSRYKRTIEHLLVETNIKRESRTHLTALVLLLLAELADEKTERITPANNQTKKILNYMEKNYAATSIRDIADNFNYTENYLTRLIKKNTGHNASKLLIEMRLAKACELLAENDSTVEAVAEKVGYTSISHFYKLFKEAYHMTPSQYREISRTYY